MASNAAPEWSESPLFAVPGSTSSTGDSAQAGSSKSDTVGAPDTSSSCSSSQNALPGSQVATVDWQQLQKLVQQQEQQEHQAASHVILLEVLCPEGQDQQQQQQPCRCGCVIQSLCCGFDCCCAELGAEAM